jgi:hypothetical protein
MANIKFSDLAVNPDTLLETPASGDYVLIYDVSEPLDINKIKVIAYDDLVNLAAQSALQALVTGQEAGDMFYASSATTLARKAKGTAGQVLKMNSGATAPEWGTPKISDSFFVDAALSLSQTSWTDIANATVDVTVPGVSTLVTMASFYTTKQTDGSVYFRWMIDGTAQPESKFEYHVGSVSHPASVIGIKTNVPSGARTCKLQYYVSNYTAGFYRILGIVLGFAE